jgi:hypothetical protein
MLSSQQIEDILDKALGRPLVHPLDQSMVSKQQLMTIATLSYEQAKSDIFDILESPRLGGAGKMIVEALQEVLERTDEQ